MKDIGEELKKAVKDSGKTVTKIAEDAGVGYFKLAAFVSGRTIRLDASMAQRVFKSLTGRDLV
jgi:hypothetical protein